MIRGIPRKKSVYAAASARTGNHSGPRKVRTVAMASPTTTISTAQTASTRTLSHNPDRMSGSESLATSQSRKVSRTRGQPGESTVAVPTTARNTTVLVPASTVERRARPRR